jgi:hypothetical protein
MIGGLIDGFDAKTGTIIEHKNRRNRLFSHIPMYEKIQMYVYMKVKECKRATLVQTYSKKTKS